MIQRRWLTAVLTAVAVAAAAGAFVVGVLAGGATGGPRVFLLIGGSLLTGLGIVLAAVDAWRRDRARRNAEQIATDAEASLSLTLNGALAPITSYLGQLAVTSNRGAVQALVGQVRQAVVDAAVTLTGPGGRSAFYAVDSRAPALVRYAYAGRAALPRDRFEAGTLDGDFVLDLVQRGDLVFIDDVVGHQIVDPRTGGYRTLIAVTVTAGRQRYGMLTVDAPNPGDLTRIDVELVRVLSNLLATALSRT